MVNYGNGKIYKIEPIVEHAEGDIYIGSTTKKYLSQRMDTHRSNYKGWKDGKRNKTMSYELFDKYGIENCDIILLESVNANCKDELHTREAYYIKTLKCVNKNIPKRTQDEIKQYKIQYIENNKDKIKEYNQNNKDKIKEYQKKIS